MKKMSSHTTKILILNFLLILNGLTVNGNQMIIYPNNTMDSLFEVPAQLKILSWNIGMLPILDLFKEKDERAQAIANSLYSKDYDIVVFQEVFSAPARAILSHTLQDHSSRRI